MTRTPERPLSGMSQAVLQPSAQTMARALGFRDQNQFAILEGSDSSGPGTGDDTPSPDPHASRVLRSIDVEQAQNTGELTPNGLAAKLQGLHLHTPTKEAPESILKGRGRRARPPIGSETFKTPEGVREKHAHFAIPPAVSDSLDDQSTGLRKENDPATCRATNFQTTQLEKHTAGQFDYVLRVPLSPVGTETETSLDVQPFVQDRYLYFGCNILERRTRSASASRHQSRQAGSYTVVAVPTDENEKPLADEEALESKIIMATSFQSASSPAGAKKPPELQLESSAHDRVSPKALKKTDRCSLRSPGNPLARIEDSFEAIDQLEEQLEALHAVVQVERVPSPDKMPSAAAAADDHLTVPNGGPSRALSTPKKAVSKSASVRIKTTQPSGSKLLRRSSSAIFAKENQRELPKSADKKPVVARPASLLPPKPLAKSGKPPTMPTFELPGEAVARRLKEQREARLAQPPLERPLGPSPQRTKSLKAPTRPNFELPGEVISRRKREEREARLKMQEEEERKRREFKARPVRHSIVPSSYPRETITSRARQQNKPASAEAVSPVMTPKRQSVAAPGGQGLAVAGMSSQNRGRCSALGSPSTAQASRATSTSTGSVSGKRSNVSTDDVSQQRQRGKEILQRDNSYSQEREREKREREEAARIARQEAAERSRLLSREWALKKKLKGMVGSSSPSRAQPV